MDFVAACLVTMTEAKRDCRLTLDSDFRITAGWILQPRELWKNNWYCQSAKTVLPMFHANLDAETS